MSIYNPPVSDMTFLLTDVLGFEDDMCDAQTIEAVLSEAAKLASEVLAPLNAVGDKHGARLEDGEVKTAPGFKEAYAQYCESGWNAVPFSEEYGGQGLPWALAFPIQEMWQGANMSFGLCPLLNQGAVEAILEHGTDEQKDFYLPKLIEGTWAGTMNISEPEAGSDLGTIRTKAEDNGDGTYKITGQKIFITYGDHDLTDNIIHLVLARLPDAPADIKGISMFIVPKFLEDGSRNNVKCIGLEHKMGIHASPTATLDYDGATGYLLGRKNRGLRGMFTMMNNARLTVGLQGVAIAEAAYQLAAKFATERKQGRDPETGERISIDHHADVRRMLLFMKSQIEAARALTYEAAVALTRAEKGDKEAAEKVEFLTQLVKCWCTDIAVEVISTGVQVMGGMGFTEEAGIAQHYRDVRILPIYEGTNGIQASGFIFRHAVRDDGAYAKAYIDNFTGLIEQEYIDALKEALDTFARWGAEKKREHIAAAASPYLKAFGYIAGGALLALSAQKAKDHPDPAFAAAKKKSAEFYAGNILPLALAQLRAATEGSEALLG